MDIPILAPVSDRSPEEVAEEEVLIENSVAFSIDRLRFPLQKVKMSLNEESFRIRLESSQMVVKNRATFHSKSNQSTTSASQLLSIN